MSDRAEPAEAGGVGEPAEQAEQLDQALQRVRAGEPVRLSGELRELVELAGRLERELPDDLPDPAFRRRLRQQLLPGAEPAEPAQSTPTLLPIPLHRHWYQDWRVAVVAATIAVLLVGGVVFEALNQPAAETPAQATVASAFAPAAKSNATTSSTANSNATETEGKAEGQGQPTKVVTNTNVLPPIDLAHVVQVPLGLGAGPSPAQGSATPEAGSPTLSLSGSLPTFPDTARSWLLSSPPSATTFVQNELARLGITGTVRTETQNGETVVLGLDETGFPVLRWRPSEAFFMFERGPNMPTPPAARAVTDPKLTATDWLEEIGFDMTSIKYSADLRADSTQQLRVVEFRPIDIPAGAIDPGIGVVVGVRPDGSISYANGFWLSLVESAQVPLRSAEADWQAAQQGEGMIPSFGPPPRFKGVVVKSAALDYVLTRADQSSYLLEPVAAFTGETQGTAEAGQVTIYVAAAQPATATPVP